MTREEVLRLVTAARAAGKRPDLHQADLHEVDLYRVNLSGADLSGADLSGADLCQAILIEADLRRANLSGAKLKWAELSNADLRAADLRKTNLSWANLSGADLTYASGILVLGPGGPRLDMLYVVRHEGCVMVKAGCFWRTLDEFAEANDREHGDNKHGRYYRAAIAFVRAWAEQ